MNQSSRLVATIFLLSALGAGPPAGAAPPLSEHAGADGTPIAPTRSARLGTESQVALAYGGGVYLAVWREQTKDAAGLPLEGILAARLGTDGVPIDDPPLAIGTVGRTPVQDVPAVAFDGSRFVVGWNISSTSMRVVYVDPAGALGATALDLPSVSGQVAVAGGNGKVLVTYQVNTDQIVGRFFDDTGAFGGAFTIVTAGGVKLPAVAGAGDEYFVAWEQPGTGGRTNIRGARVTAQGAATPPTVAPLGILDADTNTFRGAVTSAYDGTQFIVGWSELVSSKIEIHGRLVALNGTLGTGFTIASPAVTTHQYLRPAAAYVNSQFLFAFEDLDSTIGPLGKATLAARFVDGTGNPQGSVTTISNWAPLEGVLLHDFSRSNGLASEGSRARLAWVRPSSGISGYDVVSLPIEASGLAPVGSTSAADGPATQRSPVVASNGAGYLAVWEDARGVNQDETRGTDIYGQWLDASGAPIGGPFVICGAAGNQRGPAVSALPGGDYLVAWADGRETLAVSYYKPLSDGGAFNRVFYARVSPQGLVREADGTVLDGMPTTRPARDRFPKIAADATNHRWLVTWEGDLYDAPLANTAELGHTFVGLTTVSETGVLGPSFQVRTPFDRLCGGAATWTGSRFFVVADTGCARTVADEGSWSATSDIVGFFFDGTQAPDLSAGALVTLPAAAAPEFRLAPTTATNASGKTAIVWEAYAPATLGPGLQTEGVLRGALVAGAGQATPVELTGLTAQGASPRWPHLEPSGNGFILLFSDETDAPTARAMRLSATLVSPSTDIDAALNPETTAALSSSALGLSLVPPEPAGLGFGLDAAGQAMLVYAAADREVTRVHSRPFGTRLLGERCTTASACGDGRCERDAEDPASGFCCDTPCDGPCQKCTADGCVGTPASDPMCGTVSCTSLSTTCRVYEVEQPSLCLGFGECGQSDDLSACTKSMPRNEGQSCAIPGCKSTASCVQGECVCADAAQNYGAARTLPSGCSIGGGEGTNGLWLVLLLLIPLLRRRRLAVLGLMMVLGAAACSDSGVLEVDLELDDATLSETAFTRIVIADRSSPKGFVPAARAGGRADLDVRNLDLDRDGKVDIVADLLTDFPYRREKSYLKVVPSEASAKNVTVRAAAFNRFGNVIGVSAPVDAVLPGARITLTIGCATPGCPGRSKDTLTDPHALTTRPHPVAAIATTPPSADRVGFVAFGIPSDEGSAAGDELAYPNRGRVVILATSPDRSSLVPYLEITGARAGDRLGTALAVADVTGDGKIDLVVGAPGAGRAYVVPLELVGSMTQALAIEASQAITIERAGDDLLGSSIALIDDTAGLAIALGAPGADRVVVTTAAAPTVDRTVVTAGTPDSGLGRALGGLGSRLVAGQPAQNALMSVDLAGGSAAPMSSNLDVPGGLGTQVAFADLDADGALELIAGAPAAAGAIYALRGAAENRVLTQADVEHSLLGTGESVELGEAMSVLPSSFGDIVLASAKSSTGGGAVVLVRGQSIVSAGPTMPIALDGSLVESTELLTASEVTAFAGADLLATPGTELIVGDSNGNYYVRSLGGVL